MTVNPTGLRSYILILSCSLYLREGDLADMLGQCLGAQIDGGFDLVDPAELFAGIVLEAVDVAPCGTNRGRRCVRG